MMMMVCFRDRFFDFYTTFLFRFIGLMLFSFTKTVIMMMIMGKERAKEGKVEKERGKGGKEKVAKEKVVKERVCTTVALFPNLASACIRYKVYRTNFLLC
jgi:hypothetical protein